MSEPHPTPSYRGRGRGRGARSQAIRAHVARLAQQRRGGNGRRGRQKLYDHPKPQAASERLKELKAAFSAVASALRPALEDLADRNLDRLKSSFNAYREVAEYQDVQAFLDERYRGMLSQYDTRLDYDTKLNEYIFDKSEAITLSSFPRDCDDASERFFEAQLIRLEILEQLHDLELPIEIVDDSYNFREIDDELFNDVKAHLEYRTDLGNHPVYGNKVEVPCAKTVTGRIVAPDVVDENAGKPSAKRKAEAYAEILPPPRKRMAGAADTYSAPLHIGGLLSGVLPPSDEEDNAGNGDSKAMSPTPALAEGEDNGDGEGDDDDEAIDEDESDARVHLQVDQEKLPPIPNGASEPDAWGVRLVNKRRTANLDVYNRIMVPSIFDFEPHEIGFRDSANDKSRGATKAKRGKYLNTPNSNTMHFDRSLWQYDATTYGEDELDEEMVKKHALHPKYGIFIRSSMNEPEAPRETKPGNRPIVFYTPGGRSLNASRSNKIARLEDESEAVSRKPALSAALDEFLEKEGVDPEDLRPSKEAVDAFREKKLKLWLGRRPSRDATEEEEGRGVGRNTRAAARRLEQQQKQRLLEAQQQEIKEYDTALAASESLGALLEAAAIVDSNPPQPVDDHSTSNMPGPYGGSNASQPYGMAPMRAPSTPPPPPPRRSTSSRPFDPVRDVFMDRSPEPESRRSSQDNAVATSQYADASNLLYMASLASDQDYISSYPYQQQQQQQSARHLPPRAPPLLQQQQHHQMMHPDSGPVGEYASRRMSIDHYHYPNHHHQPQQQQQHPHHHHPHASHHNPDSPLLDPRLFGGDASHQQQMHPEVHNPTSNGYGYYQQQHQQQQQQQQQQHAHSFLHTALNQGAMPLHAQQQQQHQQQQQQDLYNQAPPPPSAAYGQVMPPPPPPLSGPSSSSHSLPPLDASPTSRRSSSQYYMSPPPPQSQQLPHAPPPQQQHQHSHTLPMLRPYQGGYGSQPPPPPPPPSSSRMQNSPYQSTPPMQQPPSQSRPMSPPLYHMGNAPDQMPPMHHQSSRMMGGSVSPPPMDGQQQQRPESGGSNSNKYRKLEPAPIHRNSWSAGSGSGNGGNGSGNGGNSTNAGNSNGATGSNSNSNNSNTPSSATSGSGLSMSLSGGGGGLSTNSPAANASNPSSHTPAHATKELRTVPYDYEKIKDYAAVEPPPSHGPKAIRGWAHNNMKRSKAGAKPEVASEWEKEQK